MTFSEMCCSSERSACLLEQMVSLSSSDAYLYDFTSSSFLTGTRGLYARSEAPRRSGAREHWYPIEVLHPDDRMSYTAYLQRLHASRHETAYEHMHRLNHDGQGWRWVLQRDFILERAEDRTPRLALGIVTDVTGIKWYEDDAGHRERQFWSLFNLLPLPILEQDLSEIKMYCDQLHAGGVADLCRHLKENPAEVKRCADLIRISSANDSAKALFLTDTVDSLGEVLRQCLIDNGQSAFIRAIVGLSGGANVIEDTVILAGHYGQGRELVLKWIVAPGRADTLAQVFLSATDISEQRQLRQQFLWAQKMEAVARMSGGVAHDFSNLMMAVNGFVDCIVESLPDTTLVQSSLQGIRDTVARASRITQQLVSLSRCEPQRIVIVDLNRVIMDLKPIFPRLLGKQMDVDLCLAENLKPLKADVGQMEQVILNLLINARDATGEKGIICITTDTVYIDEPYCRFHEGVQPGMYVLLAVTDTGSGITPSVMKRIFDPFFTTKEHGTGLGLATTYSIVRQCRGHLNVFSKEEVGTSFKIYLPVAEEADIEAESLSSEITDTRAAFAGAETALVVENDAKIRSMMQAALGSCGYTVITAGTAQEALDRSEQHGERIDLLLTDTILPDRSGATIARDLVRRHPGIACAFLSNFAGERVMQDFDGVPVEILQKPFRVADLLGFVRRTLDQIGPRPESSSSLGISSSPEAASPPFSGGSSSAFLTPTLDPPPPGAPEEAIG